MNKTSLITIAIIIAIIGVWYFILPEGVGGPETSISSFEECAAAGNPVMESYPRQCRTLDGKHFVEDVSNQPALPSPGGLPPAPWPEDDGEICIQVITPARNPETGEVREFPTPCDVPPGWIPISYEAQVN